jgi:hypothetical protein
MEIYLICKKHLRCIKYGRLWVTGILVLFAAVCTVAQPKNNCSHVQLTNADLKVIPSNKILFLIADDRSGSTTKGTQPARITEAQYKKLLQVFIDKGYTGHFAIRIIGNTPNSGFEEAIIFNPVFQTKEIPKDITLTPKARLMCINQRIQDTNRIITDNNRRRINEYVRKIIVPKAINYMPNGEDKTDIFTAFRDIEMKMNIGAAFNKIVVVVMSDGVDSGKKSLAINARLPFELVLIGWPSDKKIRDQNETRLGSVDDLITWFNNSKL